MIETHWLLFTITSVVLIATPGQDMMLVMSRAITQGTRAGVAMAAGVRGGLVPWPALGPGLVVPQHRHGAARSGVAPRPGAQGVRPCR